MDGTIIAGWFNFELDTYGGMPLRCNADVREVK